MTSSPKEPVCAVAALAGRLWGLVVLQQTELADAWAEITHHRFVLRRMAQQRLLALPELTHAARRLRALGQRVGAQQLIGVATAILTWSESAVRTEAREQAGALLIELSDTLDRVCAMQTPALAVRNAPVLQ